MGGAITDIYGINSEITCEDFDIKHISLEDRIIGVFDKNMLRITDLKYGRAQKAIRGKCS